MKWSVNIVLTLAVSTVAAFDSDAWLRKREDMAREANRLKALYADCALKAVEPAENVAVPIESHPNGAIKSAVFAKKAQFFLESGLIWGEGVTVRELKADGSEFARIDAENCIVERDTKSGWAQGRVKAVYGGTVLEGEGVYLSFAKEFVAISDKAKIVSSEFDVNSSRGKKKDKRSEKSETFLLSKRADYDRGQGVIMFEDGVYLDHPEYELAADRLFAFLQGTNELKRVVAIGNVCVTNGNNCGSCDRATYVRSKGRITMYAQNGGAPASLEDAGKGAERNRLEGDKITFWIDSEQVEVENSRITVDAGGKLKL